MPAGVSKFCLLLYLILSPFTTHQYTNCVQKVPNFATVGCFLPSFAQNTPNWVPSSVININIHKKVPQKTGTYTYTMSM